jgi:hypothetical protein
MQNPSRLVAALCGMLMVTDGAESQAQESPTAPPSLAAEEAGARPRVGPLLRDGSRLVEATGSLQRDEQSEWWVFEWPAAGSSEPRQSLVMLPCAALSEMARVVESMPGRNAVFQVTGEVYAYRGRNYLLPSHAPLVGWAPVSVDGAGAAADAAPPGGSGPATDTAQDIMRELARSVGPAARSTSAVSPDEAGHASDTGDQPARTFVREGAALVARRGRMVRGEHGAWMFVFDADAEGLADPSMILLPCLLLEHMEMQARRYGPTLPLLVTGRAYLYGQRNFLMPTAYQVARELTPLTP